MKIFTLIFVVAIFGFTHSLPTSQLNEITDHCEDLLLTSLYGYAENENTFIFELQEQTSDGSYRIRIKGLTGFYGFNSFIIQARSAKNPDDYQTFGSFTSPSSYTQNVTCQYESDTVSGKISGGSFAYIDVYWNPSQDWNTPVVFT